MTNLNNALKALQEAYKAYQHIMLSPEGEDITTDEWENSGRPCMWNLAEEKDGYKLFDDLGYGYMALFKDDELLEVTSHDQIVTNDVVAVNDQYYGVTNRIFRVI